MKYKIVILLFLLTSCFSQKTERPQSQARGLSGVNHSLRSCAYFVHNLIHKPSQSNRFNITTVNKSLKNLNNFIDSKKIKGQTTREWIIKDQNLKLLKEHGLIENAVDQIALLELLHSSNGILNINIKNLTPFEQTRFDRLLKEVDSWDFTKGVSEAKIDRYIKQVYIINKRNKKGILSFITRYIDTPNDIIFHYYLYNIYKKGLTSALEELYVGNSFYDGSKNAPRVLKKVATTSLQVGFSTLSFFIHKLPYGKISLTPEQWQEIAKLPHDSAIQYLNQSQGRQSYKQFQKNTLSNAFLASSILAIGTALYVVQLGDVIDRNQGMDEHRLKIQASLMAQSLLTSQKAQNEIDDLIRLSFSADTSQEEKEKRLKNPEYRQRSEQIWFNNKKSEIYREMKSQESFFTKLFQDAKNLLF